MISTGHVNAGVIRLDISQELDVFFLLLFNNQSAVTSSDSKQPLFVAVTLQNDGLVLE